VTSSNLNSYVRDTTITRTCMFNKRSGPRAGPARQQVDASVRVRTSGEQGIVDSEVLTAAADS
jgi:hypothetical protein